MARSTRPPQSVRLTAEAMSAAIPRLRTRIEALRAFDPSTVADRSDPRIESLEQRSDTALAAVFPRESAEFQKYIGALALDTAGINLRGTPIEEVRRGLERGRASAISTFEGIIADFEEELTLADVSSARQQTAKSQFSPVAKRRVFLVHGHDELLVSEVARALEHAGLEAVVLHEQANRGRTIIEKFEEHADVGFAVVLLTPDDEGKAVSEAGPYKSRPRQNCLVELGYFVGRLGRTHVCSLVKEPIDLPSDLHGVVFVPVDPAGAWKLRLAKELKAAGLEFDFESLVS